MKRAVTMGNFDGCHLGHQALFRTLKAVAEVNHLQPTVISFEPHSNYVLRGPGDPLLLTTTEEKREFVESLGIEFLVLPFTSELAKLPFDKFVRTELIEKREVVSMFFGHDHCFGAGGKGNYETITAAFPELSTQMLSMVLHKGERVSSSAVRNALLNGDVDRAQTYLGRPYRLSGTVVVGKRLGHTIGFPTANVQMEQYKFLPKGGVYVASARLSDGRIYRSVVNIGTQPTTPGTHNLAVEAYLLDFNEDIYGQHLALDLLAFLRPEKKFASIEDLVRQIGMDADTAKNYNGNHWAE
ncbi:riboflavin biosynthesis protein RibF [Fibrobacter succinogenes subsp. succinogenes S85]|jgi:riboflavin kinase/FMN adenylyltransferase|uniref:Riboflavin biosynthesis protein n=1 Tax=Fibrobacter succinogenes (strain ATCC 19169 / S85) TaxID=59374 RepID=C9RKT7_FIBSS|nr:MULTISPECIES: riboflavin biosynthesis protein RibF [Fibrobacter]ACX75885.1 riboflavin biosynthesis protein RibF [Fibrobacter succinogenes subsp. succinogenes S85]ADL26699.1 riboflavin biosynthesis protein RibF [Fibrobacter succinogenes subsp. succinogenes S85]OWV22411.1 bifunctional riboflavin kinase/FMN adenylyltransferase [Fibrobacter sp. UWB2]